MGVKKLLSIWRVFASRNLQSKMTYRLDFFIGVIANALMQCIGYLAIWIVFRQVDGLAGWTFYEVLMMYGIGSLSSGLSEFCLDGVWSIGGQYVRKGELDRLLTRPLNPLLSILISKMEPHGLGQIIFGMIILVQVFSSGYIVFHIWFFPALILLIIEICSF